jgi:Ser-tRNA(Ala) deacylase AlaX
MPDYRVYYVGHHGHFVDTGFLKCADDQEALKQAAQYADGLHVELWSGSRFVAKLSKERGNAKT